MTFSRSFFAVVMAALIVAGCGGGSSSPSMPPNGNGEPKATPVDLGMVTPGYKTLGTDRKVTIDEGGIYPYGDIAFHCAAGGPACMLEVMVSDQGVVSATWTGGEVKAMNSEAYTMRLAEEARMMQARRDGIAMALAPGATASDRSVPIILRDGEAMPDGSSFHISSDRPATIRGWTGAAYTRTLADGDETFMDMVVVYANRIMGDDTPSDMDDDVQPAYVAFGYWLETTTDSDGHMTYAVMPLRRGHATEFHGTVDDLTGSAEYDGEATGM